MVTLYKKDSFLKDISSLTFEHPYQSSDFHKYFLSELFCGKPNLFKIVRNYEKYELTHVRLFLTISSTIFLTNSMKLTKRFLFYSKKC